MNSSALPTLLMLVFFAAGPIQAQEAPEKAAQAGQAGETEESEITRLNKLRRLYETVIPQANETAESAYSWLKEDISRILNWDYRVINFPQGDAAGLEARLNELGKERWECIQVIPGGKALLLILKRPSQSYLRALPIKEVLRAIPAAKE